MMKSIGYWIENVSGGGNNIYNASAYYKLFDIDDNWFSDWNCYECQNTLYSIAIQNMVLFKPIGSDYNEARYFVTNTKGRSGAARNIDDQQYWGTNSYNDPANTSANGYSLINLPAKINSDAMFKDGEYIVHIMMKDLVNPVVDDGSTNVIIDNFPLFHQELLIYDSDKKEIYYSKKWELTNSDMLQATGFSKPIPPNTSLTVTVKVSEPAQSVEFALDNDYFQNATKVDDFTYTFEISAPPTKNTEHTIKLRSYDISGNLNYEFSNINNLYQPAHRIGNNPTDWSVPNCQGIDNAHKFSVGDNEIYADFDYEIFGNTVVFTDKSYPQNQITDWYWNFGNGEYSSLQSPSYYYQNTNQEYFVTLTVFDDNNNSYQITKTIFSDPLPQNIDFTYDPTFPDIYEDVFFECTTPGMYGYEWDFGDGSFE